MRDPINYISVAIAVVAVAIKYFNPEITEVQITLFICAVAFGFGAWFVIKETGGL